MTQYRNDKIIKVKSKSLLNEKEPTSKSIIVQQFQEFCKRTDLHGFKYIVMEEINSFERACWTIAVLTSVIFASFLVVTAYNWYARNPIVTVIESTQGAIWDVPFPSVTICDINLVSRKAAWSFSNSLRLPANITVNAVFQTLQFATLLYVRNFYTPAQIASLYKLQSILDMNNITIEDFIKSVSPTSGSCDRMLHRCMWKNTVYKCAQIFEPIYLDNICCCTFNQYAIDMNETKRVNDYTHLNQPRRVASCGSQTALTVLINNNLEDYYSSYVATQGSLVFIDNPYNYPSFESPVRAVNPMTEVRIAVSPERTYAVGSLKRFPAELRNCHYHDEVVLGKIKQYTFLNCVVYKKVEMMMETCNCIPVGFPVTKKYPACNFYNIDCVNKVHKTFLDHRISSSTTDGGRICLAECEHFDYPLEIALGKLSINGKMFAGLPFYHKVDLTNKSLVNVFFNDLVSTRYRRDVYLNWQNILASFGGLLSLMLGFTLISGFDLVLFFTFKQAYDLVLYMKQLKLNKVNKVEAYDSQFHKANDWRAETFNYEAKFNSIRY